jgi:FMN hydrolase / 5-amino-6-(5-phospho-D-ribitylamino)uracil phosphatase
MLQISKIKAITLDLDDTLWPIWPTIERAETALGQWLGRHAPKAALLLADPPMRLKLRDQVLRTRPDIAHNMSAVRCELIRLALHRSHEDVRLAEPAFEVFFEHRMKVDLFTDALPALAFLAARFPVVAVSNGNADVHRVGIGAYFRGSVSAHEFGVGKPDRRIFDAGAAMAGVAPDEVLHVGDDGALDVLGGLNAGMQTVWLNRDALAWPHAAQPHVTVTDLGQLCALLATGPVISPARNPRAGAR